MKILAIDIGGTSIKLCISNEQGTISEFREYDTEAKKGGSHLVECLTQFVMENYAGFEAIGISTAGRVNSKTGSIIYANENIPNYTGMNLKNIFEEKFNVPVSVENDGNSAALGELYFGAGKELKDFLCLTFGTGIGSGTVINSTVYRGFNEYAAEFGHIILHPGGKKCSCGSAGCYEMYGSTTALVKKAKDIDKKYMNGRIIFEGLEQGDIHLEKVLNDWILDVAYGLVSLIQLSNPPVIIIGGGVMEQDRLVALVSNKVKELSLGNSNKVEIIRAKLGNKAGLLGAVSQHVSK